MVAAIKLKAQGFTVRVLEKGADVGGTWYWNRYPGAACDVQSVYYSYSFDNDLEQDWSWSRKYSRQPEILEYAKHVSERFNIRDQIAFSTEVNSVVFDGPSKEWHVGTNRGDSVRAKFCIVANGPLSAPRFPNIEGIESFEGESYHTSRWHDGIDLAGKRVAVIGTGATAVQVIPELAKVARELFVFQLLFYFFPNHTSPMCLLQ